MEFFIKELCTTGQSEEAHKYLTRFGKGNYKRRFLFKLANGKKIKVKSSFEIANEFVEFVREKKPEALFSGKVMTKTAMPGKDGRKKGSSYVYDTVDSNLNDFSDIYFALVNTKTDDIVLKIKKAIPKPGKNAEKIDDGFCGLDCDSKYTEELWDKLFWDVPKSAKKVVIEHELVITDIVPPEGEDDPVKIRALAKRKGKIIRTIDIDGEKKTSEFDFEA